jgi:glycosyltransferase involved in cell wall biosynthesis
MSPRVSIGLPVYNGERFIKESIDSLLTQTFTDFEIIISDNASTDSTEQICRDYLKIDKRIKYLRQGENKGALANFVVVLENSSGHYFMWASSDDKFSNNHIEKLVQSLELNHGVSVSMSNAKIIDESGIVLSQTNIQDLRNSQTQNKLSYALALGSKHHYFIYGLWIRSILNTLLPIPNCRFCDRIFILYASTVINFKVVSEATYYRRKHNQPSWHRYTKTDFELSKLYRSNVESVKSIFFLSKKLSKNPTIVNNFSTRYGLILAYTYWVLFGMLYYVRIAQPLRIILKYFGKRPTHFGVK